MVFSILDSYKRRREGQGRVIGCLLGYRENNKVSIEESFVIPHVEEEDDAKVRIYLSFSLLLFTAVRS